jgi:cell division protein FtsW
MTYKLKRNNKFLIGAISVLIIIGALIVLSASSAYSLEKANSFTSFFNHHLMVIGAGMFFFMIGMIFPYQFYAKFTKWFLLTTVLLLLATLGFGETVKGASRWLNLGFVKFQPSEFAKIILIIHIAYMIHRLGDRITSFKHGLFYPLIWIGLIAFLVMLQPNMSTAFIITFVGLVMLFVGGAKYKHSISVASVLILFVVGMMLVFPHSRHRITTFFNSGGVAEKINDQVYQAQIGLGSGGLTGVGLGKSTQANLFVSESYGDFIFSILGEELGFIGTLFVATMYLLVFFVSLLQMKNIGDKFGQMLIFGLSFNIVTTAFINIAVVLGMFPTTGITLPFISYGGSSIAMFAFSIGVIINVTAEGRVLRLRKRLVRLSEYFE